MNIVSHIVFAIYVSVIVGVSVAVLTDNRQPAKTMAWLLVLIFLPVVGVVLYFFFGQNTRKTKLISRQSLDQLTKRSMFEYFEQKDLHIPENYQPLARLFNAQGLAFPFKDNQIGIFTDGYRLFHALLHDVKNAKQHIHIDTFIFSDDALGNMMADALIARAAEGVEVRVIYDDVGCWSVRSSFYERMRAGGVQVHPFMPVRFPAFTSKVNYRNHRKLCVIDGKVGYIGGMNIATRYVKGRSGQTWRDTHLRIEGGGVYGIQHSFLVDWYFVDRTLITDHRYYPDFSLNIRNNCVIQIVTDSPASAWPCIMQGYMRILLEAKRYVFMETPYFLPTNPVLLAMRTAALSGIDVRLMVPLKSDAKMVEWASRSYVFQAAEAGVKVYFYKAGFNHSKLLIADDTLCSCGSTNIDFRSFENNFEGNAFIYDGEMALRMKKVFLDDVKESIPLEEIQEKSRSTFLHRIWESLVRLFAPLF